jgi:hypothetical protein
MAKSAPPPPPASTLYASLKLLLTLLVLGGLAYVGFLIFNAIQDAIACVLLSPTLGAGRQSDRASADNPPLGTPVSARF